MKITAWDLAQRFVGVKEIPGSKKNDLIMAMLRLDQGWPEADEVPWCFTGDIEILTVHGFIRFDALAKGLGVAQVLPGGAVTWAEPTRYVRRRYAGRLVHLKSRDLDMTCDPEHRFMGVWNRRGPEAGSVEMRPIRDLTSSLHVPGIETFEKDDPSWSDADLELMAAFMSDGFISRGRIRIQVSKVRKQKALASLQCTHSYTAPKAYGISTVPLTTFDYQIPSWMGSCFADYKMPKWGLLRSWSSRQLRHFLKTYAIFDGHQKGGSVQLYSSRPILRDWLQAAAVLAGYHTKWRRSSVSPFTGRQCDAVIFAPEKKTRTILPSMVRMEDGEAELHCVSVPSGAIVIRDRAGTVLPVGNCSAFVNYVAWLLRLPRSKSLRARSWLQVGSPVMGPMIEPVRGFDVVVLKRGGENQPGPEEIEAPGHVGFFTGQVPTSKGTYVEVLGGNQGDKVCVARYPESRVLGIRRLHEPANDCQD